MPITPTEFDDKFTNWNKEVDLPWQKLKYKMGQANVARHLGQNQMRILDAGGGNGIDAISFAKQGHYVDIVDYSQEMLADVQRRIEEVNLNECVATHLDDVNNILALFPNIRFDLIICHNVLQYIDDIQLLFRNFVKLLKPAGVISVLSVNRYSIPYHAAFIDTDLDQALSRLDARKSHTKIFDNEMENYSAEEIKEMLVCAGIILEGDYGIRCICDYWGDNELKLDPVIFKKIERLEFGLTNLYPYKLLARYFQVIGRKPKSG